jgi:hypothetical protein
MQLAFSWKGYETTEELIVELIHRMQHLREYCINLAFKGWMKQCAMGYARESKFHTAFSVAQINTREMDWRIGGKSESTFPPTPKRS